MAAFLRKQQETYNNGAILTSIFNHEFTINSAANL